MPELPEVETIRRDLNRLVRQVRIKHVEIRKAKILRTLPKAFQKALTGQQITGIARRGKLLIFSLFTPDRYLLMHLKMTGQLIYRRHGRFVAGGHPVPLPEPDELPNKFTHLIFHFADGAQLFFNDLRQFGYAQIVDAESKDRIVASYGVEPLTAAFTLQYLQHELKKRKTSIKQVLLDQTVIAGLGNIYVDEVCFAAKIRPSQTAARVSPAESQRLYRAIKTILKKAITHRGTTFAKYRDGYGRAGGFVRFLKVYGRSGERCLRCKKGVIMKVKVAGRGTAYCPVCQA